MKIWNVNIDDKVISKLTETKTNSKYSIEYLDKIIKPQVFILPNMSRYVDTFKVKDRDEDNSSKLLLCHIDDEKYKTVCTKIEELKKILN